MGKQTAGTPPAPPAPPGNQHANPLGSTRVAVRDQLIAGMHMTEKLIAADTQWIAMCEDDERAAFKQGCESRRRSLERRTAHLYALQCKAVELGIMEKVTVEYPERLREQERLEDDVLDKAARLPRHQQHRFSGRALVDLAHDRTFNLLVDRYTRVTTTTRPRARERRPGMARRTSSSSTSSGTDPGKGHLATTPNHRRVSARRRGARISSTARRSRGTAVPSAATVRALRSTSGSTATAT
jgi:hypothetical protein